ncbi:conserved hypothetical protein [Ricinus communis]|uniref:Uncharacterized protein n=1 Tax=Ricinus communis TaxID=3988 RepID=B9R854_RICCO|nr:conserved hypothetical protein [Ricinus communis]
MSETIKQNTLMTIVLNQTWNIRNHIPRIHFQLDILEISIEIDNSKPVTLHKEKYKLV